MCLGTYFLRLAGSRHHERHGLADVFPLFRLRALSPFRRGVRAHDPGKIKNLKSDIVIFYLDTQGALTFENLFFRQGVEIFNKVVMGMVLSILWHTLSKVLYIVVFYIYLGNVLGH